MKIFSTFWTWVTKHRCDFELHGLLVERGRWKDLYLCPECGEKKWIHKAMGTIETMWANMADDEDKAKANGFIK